jgi:hypothetical protein
VRNHGHSWGELILYFWFSGKKLETNHQSINQNRNKDNHAADVSDVVLDGNVSSVPRSPGFDGRSLPEELHIPIIADTSSKNCLAVSCANKIEIEKKSELQETRRPRR